MRFSPGRILAAAATIVALVAAPATAASVDTNGSLQISVTRKAVYGQGVQLTFTDRPNAAFTVSLTANRGATTTYRYTTASDGSFSGSWNPAASGWLTVRIPGDDTHAAKTASTEYLVQGVVVPSFVGARNGADQLAHYSSLGAVTDTIAYLPQRSQQISVRVQEKVNGTWTWLTATPSTFSTDTNGVLVLTADMLDYAEPIEVQRPYRYVISAPTGDYRNQASAVWYQRGWIIDQSF